MNSNNITMHKFGIENNYISMAMNAMLGKTNNTIKSMNISETNAVVIDANNDCIIGLVILAATVIGLFAAIVSGIGTFWFLWGVSIIYASEVMLLTQCNW